MPKRARKLPPLPGVHARREPPHRRRRGLRVLLVLLAALGLATSSGATSNGLVPPGGRTYVVRAVRIDARDIFDADEAETFIHDTVNALHYRTREHVIRREVLLAPGDAYCPELAAETERNLRALDFIAQASVTPLFRADGTVDVHVRTRDRFTLRLGLGGGLIGGARKGNVRIGESNLLGLGLTLKGTFEARDDQRSLRVGFVDPDLLGTRHRLDVDLAWESFGKRFALGLVRPFDTLATPLSWGGEAAYCESTTRLFSGGDEVASFPDRTATVSAFATRAFGSRTLRLLLGAELEAETRQFLRPGADRGPPPQAPPDRDTFAAALVPGLAWAEEHLELERIDALDAVEDIALGVWLEGRAGLSYWHAERRSGLRTPLGGSLTWVARPLADHLIALSVRGGLRLRGGIEAWELGAFYHHYLLGLPWQTLALSLAFDAARDDMGPPRQLTLGEDSGLRGFDARVFEGTRRLRLTIEDRIFTPIELFSVRLGLVAFFDAGCVWRRSERPGWDDVHTSVGFGARIGSARFLKTKVVRFDVAFPLTGPGEVSFSVSAGQVFDLLSRSDELADSL